MKILPDGDDAGRERLRARKARLRRLMDYEEMVRYSGRRIGFEEWWGRWKPGLAKKEAERAWERLKVNLKQDGIPFTLERCDGGKHRVTFAKETVLWFNTAVPDEIERTISYPNRRKYYLAHREARLAEARTYYKANRDKVLERGREWRKCNRTRDRENHRARRKRRMAERWQVLLAAKGNQCALCEQTFPTIVYELHLPDEMRGNGGRQIIEKGSEPTFQAMLEVVELRCANCNRLMEGRRNRPRR